MRRHPRHRSGAPSHPTRARFGALLLRCCVLLCCGAPALAAPAIGYHVIARYPHPDKPFTQGFEIEGDTVFESSGLYDRSFIDRWSLSRHRIERRRSLPSPYFGEGLTVFGQRIYVLTWREQRGFIFDKATLRPLGEFSYHGEGWGLTHNRRHLIASDGSDTLRIIDPNTLHTLSTLAVTDAGRPVAMLNELEWLPARGRQPARILANIWQTNRIVAIDPDNGHVTAELDLDALYPQSQRAPDADVLNGIAYDARDDTLLLTGKFWPTVYRVRLTHALP